MILLITKDFYGTARLTLKDEKKNISVFVLIYFIKNHSNLKTHCYTVTNVYKISIENYKLVILTTSKGLIRIEDL